jgi:hypothetical protein
MGPSETLRHIAQIATNPEVQELARRLADDLEVRFDAQTDRFQTVLSDIELGIDNRLNDIMQRLELSEARQGKMLALLENVRAEVRRIQARAANDASTQT